MPRKPIYIHAMFSRNTFKLIEIMRIIVLIFYATIKEHHLIPLKLHVLSKLIRHVPIYLNDVLFFKSNSFDLRLYFTLLTTFFLLSVRFVINILQTIFLLDYESKNRLIKANGGPHCLMQMPSANSIFQAYLRIQL